MTSTQTHASARTSVPFLLAAISVGASLIGLVTFIVWLMTSATSPSPPIAQAAADTWIVAFAVTIVTVAAGWISIAVARRTGEPLSSRTAGMLWFAVGTLAVPVIVVGYLLALGSE